MKDGNESPEVTNFIVKLPKYSKSYVQEPMQGGKQWCNSEKRGYSWVSLLRPCQPHDLWSLREVPSSCLHALCFMWENSPIRRPGHVSFYRFIKCELTVSRRATKDGHFSWKSWMQQTMQHRSPWVKSSCNLGDGGVHHHDLSKLPGALRIKEEAWEQTKVEHQHLFNSQNREPASLGNDWKPWKSISMDDHDHPPTPFSFGRGDNIKIRRCRRVPLLWLSQLHDFWIHGKRTQLPQMISVFVWGNFRVQDSHEELHWCQNLPWMLRYLSLELVFM